MEKRRGHPRTRPLIRRKPGRPAKYRVNTDKENKYERYKRMATQNWSENCKKSAAYAFERVNPKPLLTPAETAACAINVKKKAGAVLKLTREKQPCAITKIMPKLEIMLEARKAGYYYLPLSLILAAEYSQLSDANREKWAQVSLPVVGKVLESPQISGIALSLYELPSSEYLLRKVKAFLNGKTKTLDFMKGWHSGSTLTSLMDYALANREINPIQAYTVLLNRLKKHRLTEILSDKLELGTMLCLASPERAYLPSCTFVTCHYEAGGLLLRHTTNLIRGIRVFKDNSLQRKLFELLWATAYCSATNSSPDSSDVFSMAGCIVYGTRRLW